MKFKNTHTIVLAVLIIFTMLVLPMQTFADSTTGETVSNQKYYLGELVNAGENTGYSEQNAIEENDLHYGWELGRFSVSDFTRVIANDGVAPVFLKNVGDKVTLSFTLNEDIAMLNDNEDLSIAENKKAFDEYFGITETNFEYGTLIIRHTDYQNYVNEPIIHTDYLTAIEVGADTTVEFLEEGDYEVALNYKIKSDPRNLFGLSIFPGYSDYRIFFEFSVRNGNAMVYPFDVSTGEELTDTSITENGFHLDLAKSRYLDIDVKKEVLQEGAAGLTEDVRFNRPARDGEEYTDEGIYTFTVSNRYTEQETTKTIYVGTNDILKAYVTTGLSIAEIENQVADGATINADGTIEAPVPIEVSSEVDEPVEAGEEAAITDEEQQAEEVMATVDDVSIDDTGENNPMNIGVIVAIGAGCLILVLVLLVIKRKSKAAKEIETEEKQEDEL